jgi:hypothetical protein
MILSVSQNQNDGPNVTFGATGLNPDGRVNVEPVARRTAAMENQQDEYALATLAEIQNGFQRRRQEHGSRPTDAEFRRLHEWALRFFLTAGPRAQAAVVSVLHEWKYGQFNVEELLGEHCFRKSIITVVPWIVGMRVDFAVDFVKEEVDRQMWRMPRGVDDRDRTVLPLLLFARTNSWNQQMFANVDDVRMIEYATRVAFGYPQSAISAIVWIAAGGRRNADVYRAAKRSCALFMKISAAAFGRDSAWKDACRRLQNFRQQFGQ